MIMTAIRSTNPASISSTKSELRHCEEPFGTQGKLRDEAISRLLLNESLYHFEWQVGCTLTQTSPIKGEEVLIKNRDL